MCSEIDFSAFACNTRAKVWNCHLGFQGDTIIALIPLVPQQKVGTMSPLPLFFAPAPPLGQKLEEMDSPDFFPIRTVQDRIPLCVKQDYSSMPILNFSTCGFLLQTTKKACQRKLALKQQNDCICILASAHLSPLQGSW